MSKLKRKTSGVSLACTTDSIPDKGEELEFSIKNTVPPKGMITIGVAKGLTTNLGNYESARVDAWATMTVDVKDYDKAVANINEKLDTLLDEELTSLAESLR